MIDLQPFCVAQDDLRIHLARPWSRDEWSYATNGHIIVRVPRRDTIGDNASAPGARKLFDETPIGKWCPVPETAMPAKVPCRWCEGMGKGPSDRRYKCENCNGTRELEDMVSRTKIVYVAFANRFLALIQGWEIAPNPPGQAARIRYGDAEGLLMPMRE